VQTKIAVKQLKYNAILVVAPSAKAGRMHRILFLT
jgi:hypothetical protein